MLPAVQENVIWKETMSQSKVVYVNNVILKATLLYVLWYPQVKLKRNWWFFQYAEAGNSCSEMGYIQLLKGVNSN